MRISEAVDVAPMVRMELNDVVAIPNLDSVLSISRNEESIAVPDE